MPRVPQFGINNKQTNLSFIMQDLLNGMGSYFTQEIGSLNWIECYIYARALASSANFIQLMANQLSPASANVLLNDWAQIYNQVLTSNNTDQVQQYIEFKQSLFGTPPTFSNIAQYFKEQLGQVFIELQWRPELQQFATTNPTVQVTPVSQGGDGYQYSSPLSGVMVYVWQPRDNQDNLLMPTSIFNSVVDSYHAIIEAWNPSYIEFITMNLTNRGNQDGYGGGYNGLNYNNYLDGYNVVSGTAGSNVITGVNTSFYSYPNGNVGDFKLAVREGFYPPIQIVDDTNTLQTYYVQFVESNTRMLLTTNIINNITSRTYRTLGIVLDTAGMLDSAFFNY